jgi:predicted aspartyl protease
MMRQTFAALVLLASSSMALAQNPATAPGAAPGASGVDEVTQTQDVTFRTEHDDRMTVPVRVSGSGPYRFLVDTGADRTAISRELAGSLGLANSNEATMHSVSGASTVETADVPQLELAHQPQNVRHAALLDKSNMGADGILGIDSLKTQRVQFDFEKQTLSIVPSATRDFHDEPGTIVVQGTRKNGRLILSDASADGHPLTVVIDTGAEITIGNEALRQQLIGRGLVGAPSSVSLQSVTGDMIVGDFMFVRTLEIGGVTLKNLAIVFADAHSFKALNLDRRPAVLLGMNAIRAFKKVSIDFARKKFKVVLPESSQLEVRMADARL